MFFNVCFLHLDHIKVGLAWTTEEQNYSWRNTSTFGSRCHLLFLDNLHISLWWRLQIFLGGKTFQIPSVDENSVIFFLYLTNVYRRQWKRLIPQYLWVVCTLLDKENKRCCLLILAAEHMRLGEVLFVRSPHSSSRALAEEHCWCFVDHWDA